MLLHYNDFPRFWSKVDIGAPDECWPWLASKDPQGYGNFHLGGRIVKAHRMAYELLIGCIPRGLTIDHLCRVHNCVNPHHLESVTNKVNALRGISPWAVNARRTHCIQGHLFDIANTGRDRGKRSCKQCKKIRDAERYRRSHVT